MGTEGACVSAVWIRRRAEWVGLCPIRKTQIAFGCTLRFCKGFELKVWNYSEQSFLVESILMQRSDVAMVPNQQTNYLQMVVKPHSVEVTDVSVSIMRILTQTLW